MKRIFVILLTVILIFSLSLFVSADESEMIEVLDFTLPNSGSSYMVHMGSGNTTVSFPLPFVYKAEYIDLIVEARGTLTSVAWNGSLLSYINLGNGFYRIYGKYTKESSNIDIRFHFSTSSNWVNFNSVKISTYLIDSYFLNTIADVVGSNFIGSISMTENTNPGDLYIMWQGGDSVDSLGYDVSVYSAEWRKYDQLDFLMMVDASQVTSIAVEWSDNSVLTSIPFEVSPYYPASGLSALDLVRVTVDVRNIMRNVTGFPMVRIYGTEEYGELNGFALVNAGGSLILDPPDATVSWLDRIFDNITAAGNSVVSQISDLRTDLINHFNNISSAFNTQLTNAATRIIDNITTSIATARNAITSYLDSIYNTLTSYFPSFNSLLQGIKDGIVGGDQENSDINSALQTQEDVNHEINVQVGSAVDSWDGNIQVVSDGFVTGYQGAVPALEWVGNIAQSIFGALGWFGYIYFFLGFLAVFFLIMSKSGLGARIINEYRGDG